MTTLRTLIASTFAAAILLAGCDGNGINFAGTNGNLGGGLGPGGPGGTSEPTLVHSLDAQDGFFNIDISGDGSRLVFVSNQDIGGQNPDNGEQIFSADAAGASITQITMAPDTAAVLFLDFDITENGDRVLYSSREDLTGGNPQLRQNLYLSRTDGSGTVQVTDNTIGGFYNEWEISGDGNSIVFTSEMDLLGTNASNQNEIFSMNTDGSNLRQLTFSTAFETNLTLSGDGSTVAFVSTDDPLGMNTDASRELFVFDFDGSNVVQLTDTMGIVNISKPRLTDEGSRVVFGTAQDLLGTNPDGEEEVYVVNSDATGLVQISNSDRPSGVFLNGSPGDYDISGTGNYVVFGSDFDFTGQNPNNDHTIYWATANGSTIGQPLRQGTIRDGLTSYRAYNAKLDNFGDVIAFETSLTMSSTSSGSNEKLFVIDRQ